MRWFSRQATPDEEAARRRQQESLRSLESGGLPLNAVDRLREQAARQGTPGSLFTGDLSVNELLLARHAGYEALGQVMGSSVYHVGWQYLPQWSWRSGELEVLTHAFSDARSLALGRLQQEAALLGASGVIGVRLEHKEYEWGAAMLEFQMIGTAVRELGRGHPGDKMPWASDLSGREFWQLKQAGFRPVGLAIGNCSYYQVPTWRTRSATQSGFFGNRQNQELPDYTQAVYGARSLAMGRMEAEARAQGASGVVGADVHVKAIPREVEDSGTRIDMLFHFTAIGTSIAPISGPWPHLDVDSVLSVR